MNKLNIENYKILTIHKIKKKFCLSKVYNVIFNIVKNIGP